ncbi:MAG: phage holin family protein [Defluviitaleaceae bacterium]|nr:phage holin family protein [Defluviitaleaceae bacterium]
MNADIPARLGLTALVAAASHYFGAFSIVLWVLGMFFVLDYITGIVSAFKYGRLRKSTALWGFIKKLGYVVLVMVALGVDLVIGYAAGPLGWDMSNFSLGKLSIFYLVSEEAISILENLAKLDVEVPFLSRGVKVFRDRIDKQVKGESKSVEKV